VRLNPEALARASSRRPWRTVAIWALVLVAGMVSAGTLLGPALTTDFDFTNTPEAKHAQQVLEDRSLTRDLITETWVMAGSGPGAAEDPAFVSAVNDALGKISALGPDVVQQVPQAFPLPTGAASDPVTAALGPIPSADGQAVLFSIVLTGDVDEAAANVEQLQAIREEATTGDVEAFMLGQASSTEDFKKISEEDLRFGESIGVLAAIIVLIIVFGAVVAGVTPIVMGIFAIAISFGIVGLFGQLWRFSFFAPNLISMMGLAVGIDYSLFIVSRYREERQRGREKLEAIGASGATANRAVFFSGTTVVLALGGMLLVPTTIFRSLAGGAIIVVFVSVAASMTLLPAILALLGDKINAGRIFGRNRQIEHGRPGGFWDRATRRVMANPVLSLVLAAAFLIALSLPFFVQAHAEDNGRGFKEGFSGITTLPDDIPTKQAFNALVKYFPDSGLDSPARVVLISDGTVGSPGADGAPGTLTGDFATGASSLTTAIADDPSLGEPAPPAVSPDGTVAVIDIPLAGAATDSQSEAAVDAIARLRTDYIPAAFGVQTDTTTNGTTVLVGGDTAFVKDFFDTSDRYTPWIIGLVLLLSFILLTVVFRSLVVPFKAIVMNLLSVGAAYGAIVLVFQKGDPNGNIFDKAMNWIGDTVASFSGFTRVDAIEAWLPLFLFSILFGLSMDYHVFLLTRIREEYDKTHDNAEAVAYGLRTTGGIITGAAIIMVAVFSGFAAGRLTSLEQMGFGLAVAVFIDATVVRSILVPSTMRLLGDRNWYLPRWLEWLPKIDVEGHAATITVPDAPAELVDAERGDTA
jgi:RND superfamily putative drug exporter